MKRWLLAAAVAILLTATGSVRAQGHSAGIQVFGAPVLGVYKTGGHFAPGYGYAPASYGYAPAGYAPMMAPSGGCHGFSAGYGFAPSAYAPASYGYAPMMAPSGGCHGFSAGFGYAAPTYAAPPYGYSGAQAGFGPMGILETIQIIKQIREVFDQGRTDPVAKTELDRLRTEVESLRKEVKAISVPPNLDKMVEDLKKSVDDLRVDFEKQRRHLKTKDPSIP